MSHIRVGALNTLTAQESQRRLRATETLRFTQPSSPTHLAVILLTYTPVDKQFFCEDMPAALDGLIPRYTYTQRIRGLNEVLARTRYIGEYASNIRGGFLVVYIVSALFVSVFGKLRTVELWAVLVSELVVFAAGVWWSYRWKPKYVMFVEQEMERFTALDVGVGVTWESVRMGNGVMYSLSGSEAVVHVPWKIVVKRKMADGVGEDGVEAEGAGEFLPAYSPSLSVLGTSSSESNVIGGRALPKYEDV